MAAPIAQELERLLNPLPDALVDPEDDPEDATAARVVEKFDEGGPEDDFPAVGLIRKGVSTSLVDADERYRGKATSRQAMEDQLWGEPKSADKETSEEEESEESGLDSESLEEEMNDEDPDMEEEEEEATHSIDSGEEDRRDPLANVKKAELHFQAMDDFEKFAEGMDDVESGEEEEEEGSGDEITSEEGSEAEDGAPGAEDGEQDRTLLTFSEDKVADEVEKGKAVKNQIALWDQLLEGRIKLQKALATANQLPQPDTFPAFKTRGGPELAGALKDSHKALKALLRSLVDLQDELLCQYSGTRHLVVGGQSVEEESAEETPSGSGNGDEGESMKSRRLPKQPPKRKLAMDEYPEFATKRFADFRAYRNSTLQKWHDKTKLASGKLGKGFSAFERSVLTQIDHILTDRERLLRRTRTKRSAYRVLGKTSREPETLPEAVPGHTEALPIAEANTHLKDLDEEIFDDSDFYHQTPSLETPNMSTAKKAKTDSGRSFQEAWTELFGVIECNGKALCILCNESVVCRTPSVRRHFDINHERVAKLDKTERKEFLEGKLRKYHAQFLSFCNHLSRTDHLTAASFQISLCLAKHGKPLSDGEIIKTAMWSGSNSLFRDFPNKDKILERISEMPLSGNTVKDQVQHMARDVRQQLTADLQKAACYSMWLDESTDINDHARLAVILRYAVGDIMREELVKLVSLPKRTQGIDIYNAVMEAFSSQDIRPEKVVSVTSDGAPSMVGATSGFIQFFVKEIKHPVIQFHCVIHQEALCARESSQKFGDVLKDVTKMVNYITARALNSRQFQALLEEVQAQYNCLHMYNNVRWLSRGRVLERFVARLDEIRLFMNENGQEYPQLADTAWRTNLMFLTDFTVHFNVLNKQLRGVGRTAERVFCDIKTFERKLQVFERDLGSGQLKYFPNLKMHLENSATFADDSTSHQEICKEFSSIVAAAKVNFSKRFLQFRKMETTLFFLTSPDKVKFEELDFSCLHWLDLGNLEMELLEFQENYIWKNKFYDLRETLEKIEGMTKESTVCSENEILKVWNSLPNKFKSMKALGIAILTLFGSSFASEQLFSALNYIASDTRNRLTDDLSAACVALKLTQYEPRLDKLSACTQQQKSH